MTHATAAAPSVPPLDPRNEPFVQATLAARLMTTSLSARLLSLVIWPVFWLIYGGVAPWWMVVGPGLAHFAATLGFHALALKHRANPEARTGEQWFTVYVWLGALNGLAYGVGGGLLASLPEAGPRFVVCLLFLLSMMAAPSRPFSPRAHAIYCFCVVLPLAGGLIATGDAHWQFASLTAIPFTALVILLARPEQRLQREQVALALAYRDVSARLEEALTEARTAVERLSEGNQRMNTILDNMNDGVMLFGPDLGWRLANRQLSEFNRLPADVAYPGADGREILRYQARRGDFGPAPGGDIDAQVEERVRLMLTPGGTRYQRRTASGRWIDFQFKPLPDGDVVGIYRDITDLKQGEEEAARARAELADAIDGLAEGVVVLDADLKVLAANPGFVGFMFGVPHARVVGRPIGDTLREVALGARVPGVTDLNVDRFVERWEAFVVDPAGAALDRQTPDGRVLRFRSRRTALGHYVVSFSDISELKRREAELERAERRLSDAIESLDSAFATFDADECLVACNEAYRRAMRSVEAAIRPGEKLEAGLRALANDPSTTMHRGREEEFVTRMLALHRAAGEAEQVTGRNSWIRLNIRPTPDGGRVVLLTDISELRRREADLAAAKEAAETARQKMHTVLNELNDAVMLFERDGRIAFANDAVLRIHRAGRAEMEAAGTLRNMLVGQAERGDFGPITPEQRDQAIAARLADFETGTEGWKLVRTPHATYQVAVKVLGDGQRVIMQRDVTELEVTRREARFRRSFWGS